jgi:hypothetical protein
MEAGFTPGLAGGPEGIGTCELWLWLATTYQGRHNVNHVLATLVAFGAALRGVEQTARLGWTSSSVLILTGDKATYIEQYPPDAVHLEAANEHEGRPAL